MYITFFISIISVSKYTVGRASERERGLQRDDDDDARCAAEREAPIGRPSFGCAAGAAVSARTVSLSHVNGLS